jgi:hypothetical protein
VLLTSRRRTRAATLLTALTLIATPVVATGSAHAASWSHKDARGDVMRVSLAEVGEVEKDPSDKATDITRISVNHSRGKVTVTLKVRDVQGGDTVLTSRIVTPDGDYLVNLMRSPGMRMFSISNLAVDEDEFSVKCRGKKATFDSRRDRIRVAIPRTCLQSPAWVRAGAVLVRGDLMGEGDNLTTDDALRRGSKRSVNAINMLKVGKKVRVG